MAVVSVLITGVWSSTAARQPYGDPFEFFAPWVILSDSERRRLANEDVVVRFLPGADGQMTVFVASRLNAPPDALVAWTRAIGELKRSKFVLAAGRFSDPPAPADLENLRLDERDLESIRQCVPGDCGLKLSGGEIESLKGAMSSGGSGWRESVLNEFHRLLVARVETYRAGGLRALPPSADRMASRPLEQVLGSIVSKSPYLAQLPDLTTWLRDYPRSEDAHVESFFYWSKEHYGSGKPVISVTHLGIVRPEPDRHLPAILVASKQIFASHYVNGALGLTMVMRDTTKGVPYLVYVNRSELDLLTGFFSAFTRSVLEGRLKRQAPQIIQGLRMRIESGAPSDDGDMF